MELTQELSDVLRRNRALPSATRTRYANGDLPKFGLFLLANPDVATAFARYAAELCQAPAAELPSQAPAAELPPVLPALEIFGLAQVGWEWTGAVEHRFGVWFFELLRIGQPNDGIVWKTRAGVIGLIDRRGRRDGTDTDRGSGAERGGAAGGSETASGDADGRPMGAGRKGQGQVSKAGRKG